MWLLSWRWKLEAARLRVAKLTATVEKQADIIAHLRDAVSKLYAATPRKCTTCGQYRSANPYRSYDHKCPGRKDDASLSPPSLSIL